MDFLVISGCKTHFKSKLRQNQCRMLEIDMGKLHMRFSALNVDFDDPSLNFLDSRKPVHEGIKERYHCKSHYFTVVGKSFVKMVADHHLHVLIATSTSDELFSRINIDDYERTCTSKIRGFIDFCNLWLQHTL